MGNPGMGAGVPAGNQPGFDGIARNDPMVANAPVNNGVTAGMPISSV